MVRFVDLIEFVNRVMCEYRVKQGITVFILKNKWFKKITHRL